MNPALLRTIYLQALDRCGTEGVVADFARTLSGRFDVVTIGKAAAALYAALRRHVEVGRALVIVPRGYERAVDDSATLCLTSHPELSRSSFDAGDTLQRFVRDAERPIIVALSGGGSAAVELELRPWFTREELTHVNHVLLRRGFLIDEINTVRKHLSAIKGGRLAHDLPAGSMTLLLSDVPSGRPELVASGPTLGDSATNADAAAVLERTDDALCRDVASRLRDQDVPDTPSKVDHPFHVLADNAKLVDAAAAIASTSGIQVQKLSFEVAGDVAAAASQLFEAARTSEHLIVAGGEPTVIVTGSGQGGRTFELAAHVAKLCLSEGVTMTGLFGSSDGVDGNSAAAGIVFDTRPLTREEAAAETIRSALARSDSFSLVPLLGEAIMTGATGTNLRDLFLLARH